MITIDRNTNESTGTLTQEDINNLWAAIVKASTEKEDKNGKT